jgi:hypothetical protein
MGRTPSTKTLLLFAGLLAWGSTAQPFLSTIFRQPSSVHEPSVLASLAAHAAYLAAFWWCAARSEGLGMRNRVLLLAVQSIATFLLVHLRGVWLEAGLLAIVAAQASLLLPRPTALGWVGASTLAIFPFYVERADVVSALFWTSGVLGFQLFATAVATMVKHEAEARAELSRVNAELRAAQVMLADSARTAERLRIARELHDAVGHHLTALSINLEVARHTAPADEAIERAHGLAKSMLGEVRSVVRSMREGRALDLPRALEELSRGVPGPRVRASRHTADHVRRRRRGRGRNLAGCAWLFAEGHWPRAARRGDPRGGIWRHRAGVYLSVAPPSHHDSLRGGPTNEVRSNASMSS